MKLLDTRCDYLLKSWLIFGRPNKFMEAVVILQILEGIASRGGALEVFSYQIVAKVGFRRMYFKNTIRTCWKTTSRSVPLNWLLYLSSCLVLFDLIGTHSSFHFIDHIPKNDKKLKNVNTIFHISHFAEKDQLWITDMRSASVPRISSLHCYYFDL